MGITGAYWLFGFKTYGALSLALLLASYNYFGLSTMVNTLDNLLRIVAAWLAIAVAVNVIGFVYHKAK